MALYLFAFSDMMAILLLIETDIPMWAKWVGFWVVIVGSVSGLIAMLSHIPQRMAERKARDTQQKAREIQQTADQIRQRLYGTTGTAAEIAAELGVGEALTEDALWALEGQGFARNCPSSSGPKWFIVRRTD